MSSQREPKQIEGDDLTDAETFAEMYGEHRPHIYAFVKSRIGADAHLAEDITSQVFMKAWRSRKRFTGGSARAWLYQIARTTTIDSQRKFRDESPIELADQVVDVQRDVAATVERREAGRKLREALEILEPNARRIVQMRLEGYSLGEVSQVLGISEAAAKSAQYRAWHKLKEQLSVWRYGKEGSSS